MHVDLFKIQRCGVGCCCDVMGFPESKYTVSSKTLILCVRTKPHLYSHPLLYFLNVPEETQSEAGDSETSDFTVVSCDNYNEESRRKTNSADQKLLGRNVLDVDQAEVQEIRQQRTAQYVLDSNEDVKPQVCLELVDHSQPSRTESTQLRSQYGGWYALLSAGKKLTFTLNL